MAPKTGEKNGTREMAIVLPEINIQTFEIKLIGDSELIMHAWADKAIKQIQDKQGKKAKTAKEARDPHQEYLDSMYQIDDDTYGFPTVAFKAAAVNACSQVEGVTKVNARAAFHIDGELLPIESDPPYMRTDMVRIGMGVSDVRYRGGFKNWTAIVPIKFNADVLSAEQIINIFNLAGFGVGIGEWRPQKNGSYGRFHVEIG